jgi:hypothetical protein
MNVPEKSSDEILQELFGLCQQQRNAHSLTSSQDESSGSSDSESKDVLSRQKKHKHKNKKKKKKHKKGKKRKTESTDDEESDSKSRKRKMKIKQEPGTNDDGSIPRVSKVELKIKTEKEDIASLPNKQLTNGELSQNKENASNNYINAVTGKPVTLDDVFNTLGIVTEEQAKLKVL